MMTFLASFPAPNSYVPTGSVGGFLNPISIVGDFGIRIGMSVVDFGSGAGYFTILLGERVGDSGKVYAVDVMESALDSVRSKAKAGNLNNIDTIRADLEVVGGTGLYNESQDVVLIANALFQAHSKVNMIKEASRVLKKGGSLIVIDWKKSSGGFGPPKEMRINENEVQNIVEGESFSFEKHIQAGRFHYGMIFRK
jgi:ubiquinone/menaquinone biosynthesis C-methylase UbiE